MVNENAPAKTPEECQRQCEAMPSCKFWDFGKGNCHLRATSGPRGKIAQIGYSYGTKHCSIRKTEYIIEELIMSKIEFLFYPYRYEIFQHKIHF